MIVKSRLKEKECTDKSVGGFFHSLKLLQADECLDDLQRDGLMLIQKKNGYKFSTDAVLLSDFASVKRSDVLVDLCSGSGVVGILASQKNHNKKTFLVEIQPQVSEMSSRTLKFNGLTTISAVCCDVKDAHLQLGCEMADVVTVNPPYFSAGKASDNAEISASRHEQTITLGCVCEAANKLLKFGGKLFMVYPAEKLADLISCLRANKLEPKKLQIVCPKLSKKPHLVLVEAKKGANAGLVMCPPLVLCNEDGTETEELKKIYNRK